ncbi:MAG: TPM domain-containing protein [bacterium]
MSHPDKIRRVQSKAIFQTHEVSFRAFSNSLRGALLIGALLLAGATPICAQEFPQPLGYVNDYAGVIEDETETRLTNLCREVEEKTGTQLAVVTVNTVGDYDYADYANRLFEKWGIGKKGKDNGVLFFLTMDERKVRIEVGYGLEGILPDITVGRILDNYVIIEFRRGNYSAGMLAGTQAIAGVIAKDAGVEITGAVTPRFNRSESRRRQKGLPWPLLLLLLFFLMRGSRWFWPMILMGGGGRRNRDHWRGGGWGGGFGGGGFGGFGGGGSGGGGAGRSF